MKLEYEDFEEILSRPPKEKDTRFERSDFHRGGGEEGQHQFSTNRGRGRGDRGRGSGRGRGRGEDVF
jgi:hypothetical protein